MPNVLKTAKSADSWRPSAERRKIQTLDQCFLKVVTVNLLRISFFIVFYIPIQEPLTRIRDNLLAAFIGAF